MNLNLNDFSHYYNAIRDIKDSLVSNKYVLCSGFSGCGKTTLLRLLLEEQSWDILEINSLNYESLSNTKKRIAAFNAFKSVIFFFKNNPKLIVIDDMDVLSNTDRNFNSYFFDLLKTKTFAFPVVCIINTNYQKKITESYKIFDTVVHLKKLSFNQCFQIVTKYLDEGDETINYDILTRLIKENANDLRTVLNHLYECKSSDTDKPLDKRSRFFDLTLFDITNVLCTCLLSNSEINELVAYDTNQLVSIMHENIYKSFDSQKLDMDELKLIKQMNTTITESEQFNKFSFDVFSTNLWECQCYHKLKALNCYAYHFFKTRKTTLLTRDFPQVINKQSLAFNFNKKLVKMENQLCVKRSLLTFPFFYIFSMAVHHKTSPKKNLLKDLSKNELEVILRFVSDYDSDNRGIIVKLKSSLR